MTKEEILEQQVEALEKLLQLRKAITEELEVKIARLENEVARNNLPPYYPGISTPWISPPIQQPVYPGLAGSGTIIVSNTCPDGTPHNFSNPLMNGYSSRCYKCGQGSVGTVTTTGLAQNLTVDGMAQPSGNVFTLTNVAK